MNIVLTNNMKTFFLLSIALFALVGMMSSQAFADVTSPKKQISLGIAEADVICRQGFVKAERVNSDSMICVKIDSAMILADKGFIKQVDQDKIDKAKKRLKHGVGTIEKIALIKEPGIIKYATIDKSSYHYTFKVCAKESTIRLPEVILESDSATKRIKLVEKIPANECQLSVARIIAANPDSITATLTNKGGISNIVNELEAKIEDLKSKIKNQRTQLDNAVLEKEPGYKKEISQYNKKIVELRKELNLAKEKLNRILFASHVKTNTKLSELDIPKLAGGEKLEGLTLKKLVVTEQEVTKNVFDVAFQVCTGPETVKAPVVVVASDSETKKVNLSSRITPNTCQTSGTKISASSSDNIEVSLGGSSDRTLIITNLENTISSLTDDINTQKAEYEKFLVKSQRPSDFEEQAIEKAQKIENLRYQILTAKAELHKYLTQIYE